MVYIKNKKEFINKYFVTCPYCSYNNEKGRFSQYGVCLKCGKVIDEKTYFIAEMKKKLKVGKHKVG